jgi:GT2 family glycosyltransferase
LVAGSGPAAKDGAMNQPLRAAGPSSAIADPPDGSIAIVVLTHNRAELLQKCVENVLSRTSQATTEILIWDNASTDATREYLDSVTDPRIRTIHSEQNIGQNAYARAVPETSAPFLIELDDDVVEAPEHWDAIMRDAYVRLPDVGFLAADLEDDPNDEASRLRHHGRPDEYTLVEENGVQILTGPAGGGCAMTSRALNELVGGFREQKNKVFWLEDAAYIGDIQRIGYRPAVLADLRVHHTGGPYYTTAPKEKDEYWRKYWARKRRRTAVKKMLVKVPFVRRLNARFAWFEPPS